MHKVVPALYVVLSTLCLLCGLVLTANPAMSQTPGTPPNSVEPDLPYGGPAITPGSWPVGQGTAPATGAACPGADPCVLTGQYNQHRNSANGNAANLGKLAGPGDYSNFGLAYLYPVTNPGLGKNNEPVIAQPLYATKVTIGSTPRNMLLVSTLSDYVYAFDTSTPPAPGVPNYLWTPVNLAAAHSLCGGSGVPFNNNQNGFPGVQNLGYYGAVATPVIDTVPNTPTAFVTSACVNPLQPNTIYWYIDAINLTTGSIIASQQLTDNVNTFNASNQISRAALLLTHPGSGLTYVYVTFGDGVREIGAETGSGGPTYRYTGAEFVVPYSYQYSSFSPPLQNIFYTTCTGTTCTSSGLFPGVYAGTGGSNYPLGPAGPSGPTGCTKPCCIAGDCCILPTPPGPTESTQSTCSTGGNWAANGGGCWMSSRGPASSTGADVLLACGNGAFACTGLGPNCPSATGANGVMYWGMSAVEFPAGNATAPLSPTVPEDFYAPYEQLYTCTTPGCTPAWDWNPALYETEELSRVDQDFGTGGMTVMPQSGGLNFVVTADKAGFVYVMPPPAGEVTGSSLGTFLQNDAGLSGSALTYATEPPFRASRLPNVMNSPAVCPTVNSVGALGGQPSCDEVHEVAYDYYGSLIFIWPARETVMAYKGALTTVGTQTVYSFGGRIDPCSGALTCANFPASDPASPGGAMAIADDKTAASDTCTELPCINLWSIVPQPNNSSNPNNLPVFSFGSLSAYNVAPSGGLTYLWNSPSTNPTVCSGGPAVTSWYSTSFTEPTLADITISGTAQGAVYVPTVCTVSGTNTYPDCGAAPSTGSGVLVFTACP